MVWHPNPNQKCRGMYALDQEQIMETISQGTSCSNMWCLDLLCMASKKLESVQGFEYRHRVYNNTNTEGN